MQGHCVTNGGCSQQNCERPSVKMAHKDKVVPTLPDTSPGKRKCSDILGNPSLKKAKYEWQVKGRGQNTSQSMDPAVEDSRKCQTSQDLYTDGQSSEIASCRPIRSFNDSSMVSLQSVKSDKVNQLVDSDSNNIESLGPNDESDLVNANMCICDSNTNLDYPCCHTSSPRTQCKEEYVYVKCRTNEDSKQDGNFCHYSEEAANLSSCLCTDKPESVCQEVANVSMSTTYQESYSGVNLRHSDTSNANTEMPSNSPPRPHIDFLQRWQNQHTAKAIVDNAINKTLEGMGLSPDPNVNNFVMEKNRVEDEGISEAIQNQGLSSQRELSFQQRLTPIISQLTQASDLVFAQSIIQPPYVRSSEVQRSGSEHNAAHLGDRTVSSNDLLDHAVAIAICSRGLVRPETS